MYTQALPGTCPASTSGLAPWRSNGWGGRPCCPPPPRWTASSRHPPEDVWRQRPGRWRAAGTRRAWTTGQDTQKKEKTLRHGPVHHKSVQSWKDSRNFKHQMKSKFTLLLKCIALGYTITMRLFKSQEAFQTPIWTAMKKKKKKAKSTLTSDEAPGRCWCLPAWRWSWGTGWRGSEGTSSLRSSPAHTGLPCQGEYPPPALPQLETKTDDQDQYHEKVSKC